MSFTRFHDDPCRIQKQLQETTDIGKYMLDVPGNGSRPLYIDDPYIRLQKWGGNLRTNTINLDSDLKGLTRKLTKDCVNNNDFQKNSVSTNFISTNSKGEFTQQPRTTHPRWETRDLEQVNWHYHHLDPQEHVCMPFHNNLNTRILEKDYYKPNYRCVN
jgi:hypothetical protein